MAIYSRMIAGADVCHSSQEVTHAVLVGDSLPAAVHMYHM